MSRNKPTAKHPRRRIRQDRDEESRAPASRESVWIYGLHAVSAALENPARIIHRLIATTEGAEKLRRACPQSRPEKVERQAIDSALPPGAVHQGAALLADPLDQPALEDVIAGAGERAVIVVLDQVSDPHNIGAVLRSAAAFGALAVVQTERGTPGATGIVAKSASGALEVVPLVAVTNLARTLDTLQRAGFWMIGLDGEAEQTLAGITPPDRTALVLGAEGKGLRRLTREHCDLLVRLPTRPPIASLNISNAAAVALYELIRE
ncbi:MAG: 23S rRNA (guanosine(2251)-2'-O)-methyltransferase RlmB [Proteobacteria bacterium]|nr:23S rRNA (guanosine(2251)-2'-O)-methyltransferase RlmB [Pseudomonadota bacterium]